MNGKRVTHGEAETPGGIRNLCSSVLNNQTIGERGIL